MRPDVQATLRWGEGTVRTARAKLDAGPFVVGDSSDWALPEAALGGGAFELLRRAEDGVRLSVPQGAKAHVWKEGESPVAAAATELFLKAGGRASVALGDVAIEVAVDEGGRTKWRRRPALVALWSQGLSAALHAAVIAILVLVAPRFGGGAELERERLDLLMEGSHADVADTDTDDLGDPPLGAGGDGASRATQLDDTTDDGPAPSGPRRAMPAGRPDGQPASAYDSLREAATFGIIGILADAFPQSAALAPWGRPHGANAGMWGGGVDSFATDGIGLSGVGEGDDGGDGGGIGLGNIGTLGRSAGVGRGMGNGFSNHRRGGHFVGTARTCEGAETDCGISMNGRLPPETIQRIVRQNFGRFRLCYEEHLRMQPSLQGRVTVKFVIDRTGAVAISQDAGSDLPDSAVVSCVVKAFGTLSFPQPEGGLVTVIYPIIFSPE
jgi:hypothetical protein